MAGAFQLLPSVPTTARSLLRFAAAKSISRSLLPLSHARNAEARLQSNLSGGEARTGKPLEQSEIIFLGTGTSEGIPRVSCLTNRLKRCTVCSKATEPGNKNRRHNTSILLRYASSLGIHNILVDAGKYTESIKQCQITAVLALKDLPLVDLPAKEKLTLIFFYHSALQWFPTFGLRTIDSVIITHSHADAIGGLDDLRDWTNNVQPYIPIYVTVRDLEENKMHMEHPFMLLITDQLFIFYEHKVMKKTHYYLVDTSVVLPGAAVSELQFNIINKEPFIVHNLKVIPLPVWHGNGYRSLGFRFGDVCYISDVSDIPEETYKLLRNCELLILDGLRPDRSSSTHFGLPRALEEVRKIKPKRTLFTGMMHLMDHDKVNEDLAKLMETEGLDAQLSYDGLRVPINL